MATETDRVKQLAYAVGTKIKAVRIETDDKIAAAKTAVKNEILGGASAAYDTLLEIQTQLQSDGSALAGIMTALGLRVRVDEAQSLTDVQKAQARANIGAISTADLGAEVDYVAEFNSAL